ncbi:hypothetical protein AC579_437 [Pseudocercospora musae]|uniref:Uncharacterized protein n=1 Tax=Pseudocercospora musae TaxID=113226 RepID=A0A139I6Q4_9PEZI|nr:hypothetical protein AC579_437 [Pseudocercospora musae]
MVEAVTAVAVVVLGQFVVVVVVVVEPGGRVLHVRISVSIGSGGNDVEHFKDSLPAGASHGLKCGGDVARGVVVAKNDVLVRFWVIGKIGHHGGDFDGSRGSGVGGEVDLAVIGGVGGEFDLAVIAAGLDVGDAPWQLYTDSLELVEVGDELAARHGGGAVLTAQSESAECQMRLLVLGGHGSGAERSGGAAV